jgi:hypothetical protein
MPAAYLHLLPNVSVCGMVLYPLNRYLGSAIAQAVSHCLPTAVARVRTRSVHVEFVVDKVTLGQVFSEYIGFPCQSSFHQILQPHNHPGRYNRPIGGRRAERNQLGSTLLLFSN